MLKATTTHVGTAALGCPPGRRPGFFCPAQASKGSRALLDLDSRGRRPTSASSGLPDVDLFVDELLVGLIGSRQLKRIRDHSLTLFHTDDQVGAAEPVGLGEIGRGPAG